MLKKITLLIFALPVLAFAQNDPATDAGTAFSGYAGMAPESGLFSHAQLYNPSGSGKRVYVDAVTYDTRGAQCDLTIGYHNAPIGPYVQIQPRNKFVGGAASVSQLRNAAYGTPNLVAPYLYLFNPAMSPSVTVRFDPPVRLDAGKGLGVELLCPGVGVYINYQFREITVN